MQSLRFFTWVNSKHKCQGKEYKPHQAIIIAAKFLYNRLVLIKCSILDIDLPLCMHSFFLGVVHKLRYAFFTAFWPPTYLWLYFCYHFTKYLLNKICNSYILLTTHPPQWHNVICERPLLPSFSHFSKYQHLSSS